MGTGPMERRAHLGDLRTKPLVALTTTAPGPITIPVPVAPAPAGNAPVWITEERLREIIREELRKAGRS